MQFTSRQSLILGWLVIGSIAAFACSLLQPATYIDNEYLPLGNDSFYHARRILDTAADPAAFYQFDPQIHAPEGSLLTWPWGFDYVMGRLVRFAMVTGLTTEPMAFLIWIPAAAVFISIALIMLLSRQLSLSTWATCLAGLCVALSPLTQAIHGVGLIDHHFAEYIFILATLYAGVKWFSQFHNTTHASLLGLVLGLAPAIHNGLFILQLPVVLTLALRWFQGNAPPRRPTLFFCGTLLVASATILAPSLPFRLGKFEFYTLSWFHLYAAAGTVIAAALLSTLPKTNRSLCLLGVALVLFLVPLGHQIIVAQSFLTGTISRLDGIAEMRSLRDMASQIGGLKYVSSLYSLLIWLWPATVLMCLYFGWKERTSERLFFWICAVCGLCLLPLQYRLHYYGSFALYLPWLMIADRLASRRPRQFETSMLATSLLLLLAYALSMRYTLPASLPLAADESFPTLRIALEDLREACAKEPGIVLADNDAGHYIRYYTRCSVIANNFLLTRQHERKIELIDHLTSLSAEALPIAAPYVRYVLLRPVILRETDDGAYTYMTFSRTPAPLIGDLLLKPLDKVPPQYLLLREAVVSAREDRTHPIPYLRLFKVVPSDHRHST